jgi:hypothetical protein
MFQLVPVEIVNDQSLGWAQGADVATVLNETPEPEAGRTGFDSVRLA